MSRLKQRQSNATSAKFIKERIGADSIPSEKKKPLFSFQFLDTKHCISHCNKQDKAALADQLRILGGKTWAELRQAPRHGIGYEKIGRASIKASFPDHLKHDEDITFFAFRFSGKKPMVGYRDGEVFHIIWIDRDFTLYDHG